MEQPTPDPTLHEAVRLGLEVVDWLRWVRDEYNQGRVREARAALPTLLATMSRLYFSWALLVCVLQEQPAEQWPEGTRQLLLQLACFRDQADAHCEQQTLLVKQHLDRMKTG
jgi:hypothetical protein